MLRKTEHCSFSIFHSLNKRTNKWQYNILKIITPKLTLHKEISENNCCPYCILSPYFKNNLTNHGLLLLPDSYASSARMWETGIVIAELMVIWKFMPDFCDEIQRSDDPELLGSVHTVANLLGKLHAAKLKWMKLSCSI